METNTNTDVHRLISLQAAANLLSVSVDTIRRRISDGALPAYRVGRQLRVREADMSGLAVRVPTVGPR